MIRRFAEASAAMAAVAALVFAIAAFSPTRAHAEVIVLPPPPTTPIASLYAAGMVLTDSETSGNYFTQRVLFSQPLSQLWFSWRRIGVPPTIYSVFVGNASGTPPLQYRPPCCVGSPGPIYYSPYTYDWLNGGVRITSEWSYTATRDEYGGTFRLYLPEGINYVEWTGRGVDGGLYGTTALVSLAPVPEPATYGLVLAGLLGFSLVALRRSASQSVAARS